MRGKKTGGRVKGSVNKPKVVHTSAATSDTTTVAAAGRGAPGTSLPGSRARVREPSDPSMRKYRMQRVASLIAYENNPRTHSPAQIDLIARMITEFGFTNPVLVDGRRGIIAGHGRVLAAEKLGMEAVPTLELSHLNAAQRRAYVIADNKSAERAGWDDELLALELGELRDEGFDLSLTGFDLGELSALFGDAQGLTDPDDAPPLADPISVPGDVWLLGRHRLVCGDSTTVEAVDAALAGAKPHLMVTDPPYGVEYDADWRNRAVMVKGESGGEHGSRATGQVMNDGRADWSEAWALFPGGVAYVWHPALRGTEVAESLAKTFKLRAQIVWVKTRPVISRGDYHWQHEPLLHAVKEGGDDHWRFEPEHEIADYSVRAGSTGHWQGSRKQSTVWFIEHIKSETGHSTQKPVECMKRPITNNSDPGDAVYEPFSGSGTTIIAGEMTGRCVHAIELSPAYVDVAVKRWQAFVGAEATLESTGETFAETGAARAGPKAARTRVREKVSA